MTTKWPQVSVANTINILFFEWLCFSWSNDNKKVDTTFRLPTKPQKKNKKAFWYAGEMIQSDGRWGWNGAPNNFIFVKLSGGFGLMRVISIEKQSARGRTRESGYILWKNSDNAKKTRKGPRWPVGPQISLGSFQLKKYVDCLTLLRSKVPGNRIKRFEMTVLPLVSGVVKEGLTFLWYIGQNVVELDHGTLGVFILVRIDFPLFEKTSLMVNWSSGHHKS